jgi:fido (protein-threonine AMPylation protein)
MKITRSLFNDNADPADGKQQFLPTEIPPNLIGAKSAVELQMAEDTIAAFRGWELSAGDVYLPGKYDTEHLRNLHEHLVGNIYQVVGETRTDDRDYELAQHRKAPETPAPVIPTVREGANGELITLLPAAEVNEQVNKLATQLEKENFLMGLDKREFVERMAHYYTQYAQASPFTSGTPHVLAAAFEQLGEDAGYEVNLSQAANLNEVTDAAISSGKEDDKLRLRSVIHSVVAEGEGPEAALRRKITMQVVRPKDPR